MDALAGLSLGGQQRRLIVVSLKFSEHNHLSQVLLGAVRYRHNPHIRIPLLLEHAPNIL